MAALSDDDTLYCLCQQPYDSSRFMIECDICHDWFHGSCVGVEEYQATDIDLYHCPSCQITHGPLKLRAKRKRSRQVDVLEDSEPAPITSRIKSFARGLKSRKFSDAKDVVKRLRGYELDGDYVDKHGFSSPILVEDPAGLDLRVPPPTFTVNDVELAVGSMRELDVIDVAKQSDDKMLMREFVEYYNNPKKSSILNVISLEFSKTKLSDMVIPPRIVDELSWVSQYWPEHTGDTRTFVKPEVQKYCLMSVKDSYTDFHIDFGGTSVWYHVIRGQKIFYLIKPTKVNLDLYEKWASSASQNTVFFGDQVSACHKCVINPGETLFIPTGWIHGVYTPMDSLVFGGNFLTSYNVDLQLRVYELENRIGTPMRFQFPNFETLCWFSARSLAERMSEAMDGGTKLPGRVLDGCRALRQHLSRWLREKDGKAVRRHQDSLPDGIAHVKLLKEMDKLIKECVRLNDTKSEPTPVESAQKGNQQERTTLLGLKFKFNKIDNSLLKLNVPTSTPRSNLTIPPTKQQVYNDPEEEKLKSCYSDDTYYYPPLIDSDDDISDSPPKKRKKANSSAWTPRNRSCDGNGNKTHKQTSHDAKRRADNQTSPRNTSDLHIHLPNGAGASTSTAAHKSKAKRGSATAKQRLGKLLKIHKFIQSS